MTGQGCAGRVGEEELVSARPVKGGPPSGEGVLGGPGPLFPQVQMVKAPSRHTLINPGTSDFESWRPLGAALVEQTTELPESHLA